MEIILKKDIKGLGYKHDIVEVKPGYGRNYLIPQGYAVLATDSNKRMMSEIARQAEHKQDKIKQDAEAIASKLEGVAIELGAKAGESGKIFGTVTTLQIADALKEKGIEVDRKQISISSEVKNLGEYEAEIDLHREVKQTVKFTVVAE
ncbi:50S ribosomal protein L9 [Marinigracilibium pacificum]|uniref:Large ribosomal subunit protein bL9 n=1 Tax=Marinigracilibium pacificum TaxID=2729599 RepID=A0A848J1A4_9BACT|nr:50S ribosomal protein L9 [Marinigracilibium pacificum]NMM50583.1 50S ribosomal protein L9 [Marinigracilibium pacificum]